MISNSNLMLISDKNCYKIDPELILNNQQTKIATQLLSAENIKIFKRWYYKFWIFLLMKLLIVIIEIIVFAYLMIYTNISVLWVYAILFACIASLFLTHFILFYGNRPRSSYFVYLRTLHFKAHYILETGEEIYDKKDLEFMKKQSVAIKIFKLNYEHLPSINNSRKKLKHHLFWDKIDNITLFTIPFFNLALAFLIYFLK